MRSIHPLLSCAIVAIRAAVALSAQSQPFSSGVPAGFTQELYAVSTGGYGGIAFAPNGDVWMTECQFNNGSLHRFSASTTIMVNGTNIHPEIAVAPSDTGCGLVNHPNGLMYSVTTDGITELDPNTGAVLRTLGDPGFLSLVVDPRTDRLIYNHVFGCPDTGACLYTLDPVTGDNRLFISFSADQVTGIDGIVFDPSGERLYISAALGYDTRVAVIRRTGKTKGVLERFLGDGKGLSPDGLVFHRGHHELFTNDNAGTITQWDVNNDIETTFASGGFRGDLANVGSDGCAMLSQNATRYADGTETSDSSIVRVCGGFNTEHGIVSGHLRPVNETHKVRTAAPLTAVLRDPSGDPLSNYPITFTVLSGPNAGLTRNTATGIDGRAEFLYTSATAGTDVAVATYTFNSQAMQTNQAQIIWTPRK